MPIDAKAEKDRRDFRIALFIGGIAFAIALGLAFWVKCHPNPIEPAQGPSDANKEASRSP